MRRGIAARLLLIIAYAVAQSSEQYRIWREMGPGGGEPDVARDKVPMKVTMHPSNPETLLMRTDAKHLYRSDDAGQSWFPRVTLRQNSDLFINDVKFNTSALNGTWLVLGYAVNSGTETIGDLALPKASQGGVLRSQDGGETWTPAYLDGLNKPISVIAYSEQNASTVYAGIGFRGGCSDEQFPGLYKSTDYGATWGARGNSPVSNPGGGYKCISIREITVDPTDPNLVYIITEPFWNAQNILIANKLRASDDGGLTWRNTLFVGSGFSAMAMTKMGDFWAVAYESGEVRVAKRSVYYDNGGLTAGAWLSDTNGKIMVPAPTGLGSTGLYYDMLQFDRFVSNGHNLFWSTNKNSTSGLYLANLTAWIQSDMPGTLDLMDVSINVGQVELSDHPGYDLSQWNVDSIAISDVLSHDVFQSTVNRSNITVAHYPGLYTTSNGRVFRSNYRYDAADSPTVSKTYSCALWNSVYTHKPQYSNGFRTRGFDNRAYTFIVSNIDEPLQMFLGSRTEIGYLSIDGGGTWVPQMDRIRSASMQKGDQTLWVKATAAATIQVEPNMLLISTSDADDSTAGLFLLHAMQYQYITLGNSTSISNTAGEIRVIAADAWVPNQAWVGVGNEVFLLGNLQAAAEGTAEVTMIRAGHNSSFPTYLNGSNTSPNSTWVIGDNTYYMEGVCLRVSAITPCSWCGYGIVFAACSNGIWRYNATRVPEFFTRWEKVFSTGGTFQKKVGTNEVPYTKTEEFLQIVASDWGVLYALTQKTLYASSDSGKTFVEVLLSEKGNFLTIPTIFDTLYESTLDTEILFSSLAALSSTEKQLMLAVKGTTNDRGSRAVILGQYSSSEHTFSVLARARSRDVATTAIPSLTGVGELVPDAVEYLQSFPPIGTSPWARVFAITTENGLWAFDGSNLLLNPGAEIAGASSGKPLGWNARNGGVWSQDVALYGLSSLTLPAADAKWTSDRINVDPYRQMRWRGWSSGYVRCRLIMYVVAADNSATSTNGTTEESIGHLVANAPAASQPGGWKPFQFDIVLSAHAKSVTLAVEAINSSYAGADHMWFGYVDEDIEPNSFLNSSVVRMNMTHKPEPMQPPVVATTTATSIEVTWDPPNDLDHGLEAILFYTLTFQRHYYMSQFGILELPEVQTTIVTQADNRQATITGLVFNTEYKFTVVATNAVGTGSVGLPLIAMTSPVKPTVPQVPALSRVGGTVLELFIGPPQSDGGSPITAYHAELLLMDRVGNLTAVQTGAFKTPMIEFRFLEPYAGYYAKAAVANAYGMGPWTLLNSEAFYTNEESDANITVRLKNSDVNPTSNFPVGTLATREDFDPLFMNDVCRAINIDTSRIHPTSITTAGLVTFKLITSYNSTRQINETNGEKTVAQAVQALVNTIVDEESVLHMGAVTNTIDTHYLLVNSVSQDAALAAARRALGGPGQRLDASPAVLVGLVLFVGVPILMYLKVRNDERLLKEARQEAIRLKYKEPMSV